ncbi:post-GPI attachment to proteins factor 6 [Rhinophrynus dorsalis]
MDLSPSLLLFFLGLIYTSSSAASVSSNDLIYSSEFFTQTPQQLSFYNWYGNVRLFHFRVPTDTVLLRWLLQASRAKGAECQGVEITVHFRYGAPPVINPLGTSFAPNTSFPSSFNLTLIFRNSFFNDTFVNVTNPTPGDWYIAAHLPKDSEKIEIQGFSQSCICLFQPDLFVLREVDIPILQADSPIQRTLYLLENSARFKIFIPEYTQELRLEVRNCSLNGSQGPCPVLVTLGSVSQLQYAPRTLNCTENTDCSALLYSPPWGKWLNILVEMPKWMNANVSFEITYNITVCKPGRVGSRSLFTLMEKEILKMTNNSALLREATLNDTNTTSSLDTQLPFLSSGSCLRKYPVVREELDVVSIRFHNDKSSFMPVSAELPTVVLLNLNSEMDSGGVLVMSMQLNQTTIRNSSGTVIACLTAASPVLTLNTTRNCTTAFFEGYSFILNSSVPAGTQNIPYPEAGNWYLSMQLLCPLDDRECQKLTSSVSVTTYLSPCLNDCGPYGECRLLRRSSYLYAACSCKVGWAGWSCTDDSNALSVGHQLLATLLLTLSNLMFIPTIVVAIHHFYFVEAAVYVYNMFFSTFYHACDQPGVTVLCIMDYDTLQYCDFFGSVVSIWVTILCMARVRTTLKYVLFMLGSLVIAMSMQLDRRGIWNMMGPCLFALIILVITWTYRGVRRRHCYPPSWQRWVFFLLPGIALALIAISIYVFAETSTNYFYTHSLWHILVAGSVAFLLPPREDKEQTWTVKKLLHYGYKICHDDREELCVVT